VPINVDQLLSKEFPLQEHTYTENDTIYYGLGLGLGMDPTDKRQLRYVYEQYEGGLQALPSMAVILAYPGHWTRAPELGLDWKKIVHGEQKLTLHGPIKPAGTVVARTRITRVIDKGVGKGALLFSERQILDKASGDAIADVTTVIFARGDGGRGGSHAEQPVPHEIPDRTPDATMDFGTSPQAALIYRLSADLNPLHADPDVAATAGFKQPISHGLCTYGVAGHRLIEMVCGGDPGRMRSLSCRFSAPAYPGETIRTEAWVDGSVVSFRATIPARGVTVLSNGRADLAMG
jgi:acyl dehydratase